MKKLILLSSILLTACGQSNSAASIQLDDLLKNPLFAERYAEEMVDRVVELKIQNDPLLEDEAKAAVVEKTRTKWLEKARDTRKRQRDGMEGSTIGINEFAKGDIIYLDDVVYFDTIFETTPGPNLHIYMTTVVDPRDVEFPDDTAIDIGVLQSPYGMQSYKVPMKDGIRTLVLWDNDLERLWGFAQLSN
ncbi:MAG: hypothetical protein O2904_00920 [bacterium]|nr:hypothetical protein [bacterium]